MPKSVPTQSSPRPLPPPPLPPPPPTTTQSSPRPQSQSSHSNRPTDSKSNETKVSASSSTNSSQNKPLEMATRVSSNTTKTLSTSRPVVNETIPSFIAGDEARGAGKNRDKAKELFKINGKKLFETPKFSDMVEGSDIVFVVVFCAIC